MKCEKCGTPMIIDEWNGWAWTCLNCENVGRTATNEEIGKQEKELHRDGELELQKKIFKNFRY